MVQRLPEEASNLQPEEGVESCLQEDVPKAKGARRPAGVGGHLRILQGMVESSDGLRGRGPS